MDSSGSQESPGEADDVPGCKSGSGSPMPSQEAGELDWTAASSSHLEQVEYVEEAPHEYGRANFANFEAATPFSPQQSTSMDYEHQVSPLDPNMSSAARYSPVYSMSNSLAVPNSPHVLAISNPSSPYPGSVGMPNPSSPISSTNNPVMPTSPIDYTGHRVVRQRSSLNQQQVCSTPGPSYSAASLRRPESPIAGPSGLLRQSFFHTDRLTPSPSPHSPLQAPMTPSDNFVSSSTGPADDTSHSIIAETSELRYLSQTSDSNGILDAKVDSTREVPTPLHDAHDLDSSSPPGSYGHEATPVDCRDEDEDKSPDSRHVEVLIGYDTLRIVEPDARYIASAAESYLTNSAQVDSLDPLVVALKGQHGLVFSTEGLTRAELLSLKGRGPLLLDGEGSSSSGGLPLLLDSSIAGLKAESLVLEGISELEGAETGELEEGAVLETLKTRTLNDQDLQQLAPCPANVNGNIDTDGNISRPLGSPAFCDDEDMGDESLTEQLASHVLLNERQELEDDHQNVVKPEDLDDSSAYDSTSSDMSALLRRSKRHSRSSQDDESGNETSLQNSAWIQAKKRCDECYQMYSGECPQHRIQSISDKPVPARAWASLPAAYLAINKIVKQGGMGVFARKTIPKRTQFGPLEGLVIKQEEFAVVEQDENRLELTIEMTNGQFVVLDTTSEHHSNWMKFVRPARCYADMNLIVSQQNGSLYYTTTRAILPKQELQVGYSAAYASKRNLPVLEPQEENAEEDTENAWPCFECNQLFSTSEGLQKHLNDHDTEKDGEDDATKGKNKKTNRAIKRKVLSHLPIKKYKSSDENTQNDSEEGDFKCGTCSRSFPKSYSLKRHQQQHSGEKKHSCNICGQQFTHPYNRDRHQKKNHKKVENGEINGRFSGLFKQKNSDEGVAWLCSYCHLTFDTASMLNLHTLAHAAEDIEEQDQEDALDAILDPNTELKQCPQCSQQYTSKRELVEHTSAHGKALLKRFRGSVNPAKPYKCELCYKSFATEDRLQRHMLVHGTEESKPLQCETCFKRFLNNSALACHIKVHKEEKKSFECPICRAMFDQVMALKDHVQVHAKDGMYTCPHCSKVFYGYSLIRKHIRAFHSERKHTCSSCGKLFPTLDKLRMHMLRHSDHREFLCANCGKQFKRKDKLKEHMKRMHSAERELKLAQKPSRQSSAKKFIPKVSPTDYHRFIYKCHSCLLGFKRRGMLVNHLAKRHPDISPDSVPELNLPILKTTRDYYCQYCDKVYKSSSKRKAHILKNHPGLELPMSNRRKGGVPEIPGVPNPTFSQTVGSITTHPHGCSWCHKQYASKAKLLQHQRKKHPDLLPHSHQMGEISRNGRNGCSESSSEGENIKYSSGKWLNTDGEQVDVIQLHGEGILTSQVNILPSSGGVEYQIATDQELQELQESGIIIDATTLKRPLKGCGEGDMLSQAMSELTQSLAEFRSVPNDGEGQDHYMKILHTGHIMVTQTSAAQVLAENSPLTNMDTSDQQLEDSGGSPGDEETVTVTTAQIESSQLRQLLTNSYNLPPSPPPSNGSQQQQQQSLAILPRAWAATFTSYTAR